MKIVSTRSGLVRLPAEEPLAGGPAPTALGATRDFVTLVVRTDDGIEGVGYTFMGWAISGALRTAVDELCALVVGEDPLAIEAIHQKLRAAAGTAGPGGIFALAVAAIDIALWDIKGKHAGLPVATLAGGFRTKAPVYASGALMRDFTLDHCVKAAARLVESGYRQVKMQLALPGRSSVGGEIERVREIRKAIGPDVDLMADVNQRWDVRQALSIGGRIEEFGLYWLEDPVAHDDYPGLAAVAHGLQAPIAAGEYVYGSVPFRHMLEARAVDIVMADVMRTGGITHWLKIAGMAEAFNLPIVSHLYPELSVHLVCAVPNGLVIENMPWSNRLFQEVPRPVAGELAVPQTPGLGLAFDEQACARYAA
ncbi:MAG TPA: mandelate racemase/muconate lactonizing enzyme family protein [Burkholderiales bacterium]|nr:mandelate racemase/muconate lactonizing enzyme family protein [Burkholderiales bacterium]